MEEYLNVFYQDLDDIENTFSTLKCLGELRELELPEATGNENVIEKKAIELHSLIELSQNGASRIPGIFILYIGGRFEDFVKIIFEELAISFANSHSDFESLPPKFKKSLITDSSVVIASPGKYGQESINVKTFIRTLSKNVNDDDLSDINHQCLSITEGNMRSEILKNLFSKISITEIWKEVGAQLSVKTYFETTNSAETLAKNYLDNFMVRRNTIAHPSGSSMTWASFDDVKNDIAYFKLLSKVLLEIGKMKLASMAVAE